MNNDNDSVNHLNLVNNNNNTISRMNSSSDSNSSNSNNRPINDNEVERRNQINKQLSSASLRNPLVSYFNQNSHPPHPHQLSGNNHSQQHPLVSTIFPGRLINSNSTLSNHNNLRSCYQLQNDYYTPEDSLPCCAVGNSNIRSRTNPRPLDRRRCGNATLPLPPPPAYSPDPAYSYAEPVFNEGLMYDGYMSTPLNGMPSASPLTNYSPSSHSLRFHNNNHPSNHSNNYLERMAAQQPIYSHDSSFGSDSGYSQYTQNSRAKSDEGSSAGGGGRGGFNGSNGSSGSSNTTSALANVLGWTRRKDPQHTAKKSASKSMLRKS